MNERDTINRNNWIWFTVMIIFIVIIVIQFNRIDDLKYQVREIENRIDISNYQDWGKYSLNQTQIDYEEDETRIAMSFYETGDSIGAWYVGHDVLNKTIYLDFDLNKGECTLTIYGDFIEGKGNPEENYVLNGNLTKTTGFSFGRTR